MNNFLKHYLIVPMLCLLMWNCTKKDKNPDPDKNLDPDKNWKMPYALDVSGAKSFYLTESGTRMANGKLYKIVQDGEAQKSVEMNWLDENGEINSDFAQSILSVADLDENYMFIYSEMSHLLLVHKTDGRVYQVAGITGFPMFNSELQIDTKNRVYVNTKQTKSYRVDYLSTQKNSLDLFPDPKLLFTDYLVFGPGHLLGYEAIRKETGGFIAIPEDLGLKAKVVFKGFDANLYFFDTCNTNFTGLYALILNTTTNTVTTALKQCYDIRFETWQAKITDNELIVTHGIIHEEQGSINGLYVSKFDQNYSKTKTEVVRPNAGWKEGRYDLFGKTVWYETYNHYNNKKIAQLDLNNLTEKTIQITELAFITSIALTPTDGLSVAGYANGDPNKTIIEYNKEGQKISTTVLIHEENVVQMIPLN